MAGRETAGVTTRLIVEYVRAHAGSGAVADLLRVAGETRPLSVLEDERSWSTYDQKIALFEAAAKVLGDPDVARRIGEWVLHRQIAAPLRMVLWTFGSPAHLLRNVAQASAKFSTVADTTCVASDKTSATVRYRLHDGYTPSRHDCGYTAGLLSQAPALFGVTGTLVRHDSCQVEGAEACVYELSWPLRRRLFSGRARARHLETELRLMTDQVESLQLAAAEIVAAESIEDTIARIANRARSFVRGSGFVVAIQPLVGAEPSITSEGLSEEEVAAMRADLMVPTLGDLPNRMVADIRSSRRLYGRIIAVSPGGGDAFFIEERRILAAFANVAATALDAAVSQESAQVLSELSRALADVTTSDDVCDRIVTVMPRVVGAPIACVARWDVDAEVLRFSAVHGLPADMEAALRSIVVRPSDSPALLAQIESPEPRLYTRDSDDPFVRGLLDGFDVDAAMTSPILMRGELRGHIVAAWKTMPAATFEGELLVRMASLANQAATALENARLLEATKHQALHDPLTGLPNRILLDDRLQQAAGRARRSGGRIGILLVDLDGFKQVNDNFGHRAGDDVLRVVASRLRTVLRDADTAARFGGDEFVVICQDVEAVDEVAAIARRIEEVLGEPITAGGANLVVGASVGVAVVDGSVTDVDALLACADEAMYAVKRTRPSRAPVLV